MKEPEKFTIRVNFKSPQNSVTKDEVVSHYHWGRIIGCCLVVVIAIGTIIGGNAYYFNQDNLTDNQTKTPLNHTADITPTNTLSLASVAEDEPPVTTLAIPDKTTKQTQALTTLQKNIEENTVPVDAMESNAVKINSTITPPAEALTITSALANQIEPSEADKNGNKNLIQAAPSTVEIIDPDTLFTQTKIDVFSDNIKRFIISSSVKTNEPVGTINDIIFDNNIATVYAFSEVSNLNNTTLYYIWSLDDKDVAKVKVNVGGNRWRSYSSKFIQPNMHGEWKVELQNGQGEILAINRFYY